MKKITIKDLEKIIIQEMKTGIPYFGDEYHEEFDQNTAYYKNFHENIANSVEQLVLQVEMDGLTRKELLYVKNTVLSKCITALEYAMSAVEAKLGKDDL